MNISKITLILFTLVPVFVFGQEGTQPVKKETTKKMDSDSQKEDYGWNSRFAFMVGGGISIIATKLYLDPAINKTNNAIIIEEAGRVKPNLSLGIVYTPKVSTMKREVEMKSAGSSKTETFYEYVPRGISVALFLNPISLSKLSEMSLSNTVDLGMGLGWRSGNFSIFGTVEFFSVRQPRDYFINQFKASDKPYIVNGEIQASISTNDNDVFRSKVATAFGFKLAYTFDIVKSFVAKAND
jgi:hypothetical protein